MVNKELILLKNKYNDIEHIYKYPMFNMLITFLLLLVNYLTINSMILEIIGLALLLLSILLYYMLNYKEYQIVRQIIKHISYFN